MKQFFTSTLCLLILLTGRAQNSRVMKQVVVAEYRTWYITQDGSIWAYNNAGPLPVQFPIGGLKADTGAGGFNYFRILDEKGYVWTSTGAYTTSTARIDTDTTGAPFGGNWYIDAYGHAGLTIRADSSVWLFGQDVYALFYPGGSPIGMTGTSMAPTQLSPAGWKFKKVLFGGVSILGLTTSGQVYQWSTGGSRTPTLIKTVRPASDIFISHLNAAGCIIPDAGDNSGMGYPYIWGAVCSMWGGSANSTTPIPLKDLWNMTQPIKEISLDWNTIHYIDALGNMYGCGFNSFGEVGNGQEFINKYNYPGFPGYGWDLVDYENPSGIPVQIGKGVKWKHIYSNNWFGFYKYAMDQNDSIYSWGRNKSLALGNGLWNGYDGGEFHPNTLDVLKPTMVHPLTSIFTEYGFVPPSISVGPKQVISTSTATLKGVAQAPLCVAVRKPSPNGIDTAGYHIVSYQWTKVSGPASGTITSPNAATTTVTNLSAGTYVFNLLTTDNNTGTLSANDTIQVTSTTPGAITVNAGNDQSITLPANSATLLGAASQVNGVIVSYKWTQVSGPSTASITSGSAAQTTVTGLVQGVYKFQLLVTTALATTAVATVQVTVNPAAAGAITVSAGTNQTITLPTSSATLTGAASQVNGAIQSYKWTQVSGPSTASITSAGTAQTTATNLVQGVYKFQLLATATNGTTATATVQVTVNAAAPGQITVNAGTNLTITLPTSSATLTGSASQVNGAIQSYKWTQVSGPSTASITNAGAAQTTATNLVQGVYKFQLLATAANGTTATATMQVTVNPPTTLPGQVTVSAGADKTVTTNSATLGGSASSTRGTITTYAWTEVSGPNNVYFGSATASSTVVSNLLSGTYIFQLKATDNNGVTGTATVKVIVNSGTTSAPPAQLTVSAGTDKTLTLPTSTAVTSATLAGSATEANATISSYAWSEVSGPTTAYFGSATASSTVVSALTAGTYVFQLKATDNKGVTGTATVKVIVSSGTTSTPPAPLTVNAGTDKTITLPAGTTVTSTTLAGAAAEANGTISSYAWSEVSGPTKANFGSATASSTVVSGLSAGTYVFQLKATDDKGTSATGQVSVIINSASSGSGSSGNSGGSGGTTVYQAIPGSIQAESYATMTGVATETTTDAGGGQDVGWIDAGDRMNYNVNVATAGAYTVSFRVASLATGASFRLLDAKNNILASVSVPNTGGYQAWTTVSSSVTLSAGQQTLSIVSQNANGWNFNWMQFAQQAAIPSGKVIPGTIQAEDYDGMLGVAPETTTDVGGGQDVGKLGATGNQTGYNVTVTTAGTYTVNFRVASPVTGAVFQLLDTKNSVLATVSVPNTGGWQVWTTVSTTVTLPAGAQFLKVVSQNANGWNFNWMQFVVKTTSAVVGGVGTSGLSNNISVDASDSAATGLPAHFNLYPNPVIDQVTLDIVNSYTGRLDVQVVNMTGMVVRQFVLNKGLSSMQSPISLSGLASGVYIIRVQGTGWGTSSKVLKK